VLIAVFWVAGNRLAVHLLHLLYFNNLFILMMSANTFNILYVNIGKEGTLGIQDFSFQKCIFTLCLNKGCCIKTAVFQNQQFNI